MKSKVQQKITDIINDTILGTISDTGPRMIIIKKDIVHSLLN